MAYNRMKIIALLIALLAVNLTYGYGTKGHKIIAEIALLKLPADIRSKLEEELGHEDIGAAAVWADQIKTPRGPQSEDTKAFLADPRNTLQKMWHYMDLPYAADAYEPNPWMDDVEMDPIRAIQLCTESLRHSGSAPRFSRPAAIKLLIHLIGDIHQPLHVADAYYDPSSGRLMNHPDAEGKAIDTLGGNQIRVANSTRNLHALWDSGFVEQACPGDYVAAAQKLLADNPNVNIATSSPASTQIVAWALESNFLAKQAFEDCGVGAGSSPVATLPAPYQAWAQSTTRQQLLKAGLRLAALLKEALSPPSELFASIGAAPAPVADSAGFLVWQMPPEFEKHLVDTLVPVLNRRCQPQPLGGGMVMGVDFTLPIPVSPTLQLPGVTARLEVHIVWEVGPEEGSHQLRWRPRSRIVQLTNGAQTVPPAASIATVGEAKFKRITNAIATPPHS